MIKKIESVYRKFFPKRLACYKLYQEKLYGLCGLEIGGPSSIFTEKGFLPLYDDIKGLDGCNFSSDTVWEGKISEGLNYQYGNKKGYQIISDGSKLDHIPDGKYDFILSCHSIEHIANPIKALNEWKRVIRKDGTLLLIVPHKDNTFDHNRPVTTLDHLIQDFKNNTEENDNTHFEEVISLHDISMDAGINNKEDLKLRTADNFNNRCVHQHVFNTPLVVKIADYLDLKILNVAHFNPFHIIILLQKPANGKPDNSNYMNPANAIYQEDKFPSDKTW